MTDPTVVRGVPRGPRLAVLLGSFTALGPMSIDLYLPAFPELSRRFAVGESEVQLTLTACMLGLAIGQLFAGPASDAFGRRRPLLVGLGVYAAASVGCALATSVGTFTGLRLVQGLAGGVGVVIARAVVRDLYTGTELAQFFSMLILVNGLAPILAPLIGGQLMRVLPWPALFLVLAGYGLVLLGGAGLGLGETLPPAARRGGGLAATLRVMGRLLTDRRFVGYALASGCAFAAMFAYIAGSPFVLQRIYQLSPQLFSVAFGVNALGIIGVGQLNRVLLRRFAPRRLLAGGLCVSVLGGAELVAATVAGAGLPAILVGLFLVVASIGMVAPNTTALALAGRPAEAGSASALLGLLQFVLGAAAAPVVGAFGDGTAVPMAAVICVLAVAGLAVFAGLTRGRPPVSG